MDRYKELYENEAPLDVIRYRLDDPEQEKRRNRFPLAKLLAQNPEPYQVTYNKI